MFIKKLLITYLLLLLSLHASESNQKVTLYLDWLNQFQFAGYYMAKENGYYNDLDLDVNIIEYSKDANNDITQKVIKEKVLLNETIKVILELKTSNDLNIEQVSFEKYETFDFWVEELTNKNIIKINNTQLTKDNFINLVELLDKKEVSSKQAKDIILILLENDKILIFT